LIETPLLSMPAFQENVLRNLRDQTPTNQGISNAPPIDPLSPKPGEKRTLRICDWYAEAMWRLEGSPKYENYWPRPNRDVAIKADMEFVRQWGARFGWDPTQDWLFDPPFFSARVVFPRHNSPATQADVQAHVAIFSLGAGDVRVVPMDPFPREANWITLKQFRTYGLACDPKTGGDKWLSDFDQHGWIWQAEEKWDGGKWHRYYGFVGNHIVAKVPAEEIELVKPDAPATRP
jgi:hypothetical protein